MANFTERAIKETFIKLLSERPLSQITVKDIVQACASIGTHSITIFRIFRR